MRKLVCFHLYNDYSGSPKVLKTVLQKILDTGLRVDLVTSHGGTLDELCAYPKLTFSTYTYNFSTNPAITMFRYLVVQLYTFILSFRYLFQKDTVFYINTLLPVGPALAGRIMGKRVIYHYHENARVKGVFYRVLCRCMQYLATEIICVSHYQRSFLKRKKKVSVVSNALPEAFITGIKPGTEEAFERKTVLMLSSLKRYKGLMEFVQLARRLPDCTFVLVINDTQNHIDAFIKEQTLTVSTNLTIYPRQNDSVPFYNHSSLVLNLSNKKQFVETFGLTVLEAMAAGLPVIAPTEGGVAELVEEGINGYKIDVQELNRIEETIMKVLSDKELYSRLSKNALLYAKRYDTASMIDKILQVLSKQ